MDVGVVGYGCYIPRYRIKVEEIAKVWGQDPETIKNGLLVYEKAVADSDEDSITLAVAAARNAMLRASINPKAVGALFVGSESHPYAVKPSGTVVAEALGITPHVLVADFEFACKAGTAAARVCSSMVRSGDIEYGMAIGADTAQGQPGDALEYTAASGAAALIIGKTPVAVIEDSYSFTTDTPDFWRREGQDYPKHGARFTGEPAYFKHVVSATQGLLKKLSLDVKDFDHVIFHMPNAKFPLGAAQKLGVPKEKLSLGLVVPRIGNSYSGSSMVGLCAVFDKCEPGQRILLTSFGSGAGSDSFSFVVNDRILKMRDKAKKTEDYIKNKEYIDYGTYVKMRKKLKV